MTPGLQLRLVRSHGDAADAVWTLDPGLVLTMEQAFIASPVPVPPEQLGAAAQCQVFSAGAIPGGGAMWWLSNGSAELVCIVNDQRLPQGEKVRLNEGDAIELGLLQFVVEPRADAQSAPAQEHQAVPSPTTTAAKPDIYADFELTDLLRAESSSRRADTPAHHTLRAKASREFIDAHDNPFNDITDVSYRIGVVQPASPPTTATAVAPASAEPSAQATQAEPPVSEEGQDPAAELMRHLHAEYLRLMHNPGEPVAAMNWSLRDNPPQRDEQTLHDLTQDAARFESLYDILGHGADIQTILDSLDTLSDTNVLAEDPKVNVLRLFAPDDLLMQETRLPGLTRREHHALSADSAAALDLKRPDPRETP